MSVPSNTIFPEVRAWSRMTQRASVDFPQPVSPTRAERLAASDLEADVTDRMHLLAGPREEAAALHREFLHDALERDQRLAGRAETCGAVRRFPTVSQHEDRWCTAPGRASSGGVS